MIKGIGMLEVVIALTLSLGILTIVLSSVSESTQQTKKITANQQRLEGIFRTVDTIKSDLGKCGMRLQEAARLFAIPMFERFETGFKLNFGSASETLLANAYKGDLVLRAAANDFFQKDKMILVYNAEAGVSEFNQIAATAGGDFTLKNRLKSDYLAGSVAVVYKQVEYKYFTGQQTLKRKSDRGSFQPLLEEVTDFFVTFFPESKSVLYRIEVNRKEQIRGYIFLINMV
jgi:type II secretory pathway pseudopilin PulG